jgi:hypothetical protein
MVRGTKWLGRNVIPLLAYGYGAPAGLAAQGAVQAIDKPKAPGLPPAVPLPDEEDIKRSRRRSSAAQLQRSGRASTILSDSDRLGP